MKILISLILTLRSLSAFTQTNPVVIELFTSQGCSSCPAADKNLADILERAEKNNQPVYGLSFHVDYWNHLGWKDPYSKPEYTLRQRNYSKVINSEGVYTPQMIVNGEVEFVGSNKKAGSDAIANASTKKKGYPVSINSIQHKEGKILISYSSTQILAGLIINAAVVEKNIENDVPRGENSGRRLAHRNVVRAFSSEMAINEGVIEIDFPSGLSSSLLIVYIQDKQWHILGAATKPIN